MIKTFKDTVLKIFHRHSLPRWMVLIIDVLTVFLSFLFAYLLRFNLVLSAFRIELAFQQALIVLSAYSLFMIIFKSYAGLIRQTTIRDAFNIFLTNSTALVILLSIVFLSRRFDLKPVFNIPISILLIHYGVLTVLLVFFRIFIKMFYEFASASSRERKNVIVYGAG